MKGVDLTKAAWFAVFLGILALGVGGYVAYQALRPSQTDKVQQACERAEHEPKSPEAGISADAAICNGQIQPQ